MIDRETKAVLRIPYALAGVIMALLLNLIGGVWFLSGFQSEVRSGMSSLAHGQNDAKEKIERLGERMYTQADGLRDREQANRRLDDHEVRIRTLETRQPQRSHP